MGNTDASRWKGRIPDMLSYSRIVMVIPLLVIAYLKLRVMFLVIYSVTMLTDCIDGFLARRWNVHSVLGAAADAVPDLVLGIASIPMLYFLVPDVFRHYLQPIIGIAVYAVLTRAFTSFKNKGLTGMHLLSGKATMVMLAFAVVLSVLLERPNITVPLFLSLAALNFTEELLIQMLYTDVHPDTTSIFRIRHK